MKKILSAILITTFGFGNQYISVLKPLESFDIKSEVSGKIIDIKGENFKNSLSIVIDNNLEKTQLSILKSKLKIIEETLDIRNVEYLSIKDLTSKSITEKNIKLLALLNLELSKKDLIYQINSLEDVLSKKTIEFNDLFIKNINVNKNEYVGVGSVIANVENQNESKVEFYVDKEDLNITIDNIETTMKNSGKIVKFEKIEISNSTDEKYISKYKVILKSSTIKDFGAILNIKVMK